MPINLITGPINSGKTTRLLKLLCRALEGGPAFYVVPNESIAEELSTLFLELNGGASPAALLGNVFITYHAFIRLIANESKTTLTPHQQALFCMRILMHQRLKYFRKDRISFGIAKEAAQTITALKRNLITPDSLASMLETRGTLKEYDLRVLFKTYEIEKAQLGVIDIGDLYTIAADKLKHGGDSCLKDAHKIIFDEFFAPEPGMLEIFKLIRNAQPQIEISISLPEETDSSELFSAEAADAIRKLSQIADSHERLSLERTHEPTINVISTRSPLKQIRFLVDEVMGEAGDEPLETVLSARRGDFVRDAFLSEIWGRDRDVLLPRSLNCALSPALVRMLEGPIAAAIPRRAIIEKFAEFVAKEIRQSDPVEKWRDALVSCLDRAYSARSFSAITSLDSVLNSTSANANFLKIGEISRETFLEMVWDLMDSKSSFGSDAVPHARLAFFEDGISNMVDKIIIPNMVEGHFPTVADNRLFFTDQEELGPDPNRLLDAIFPNAAARLAREAFLFQTWISKARREVLLARPSVDEGGSETVPSSFLDGFGMHVSVEPALPRPFAASEADFEQDIARKIKIEEARHEDSSDASFNGNISDPDAQDIVRRRYTNAKYSASQLETYAECPFTFFLERVLGLKPEEDVTREILPKDRGTIIHTILERFYSGHMQLFKDAAASQKKEVEIEKIIEALSEEAFKEHASLIAESSPVLHPFQKRAIKTVVRHVIMKEIADARNLPAPLYPKYCEWAFGDETKTVLKLDIEGEEPASVQGRVDRIDVTEDNRFFAITDYKTGRKIDTIASKLKEGRHLQLPLYVRAVKDLLLKDAVPLGGFLLAVMTAEKKYGFLKKEFNDVNYSIGKRISSLMDENEWEEILDSALTHASKYIAAIRAGKFSPTKDDCPNHCSFGDVCRKAGS